MITNIEEATAELRAMEQDVIADFGDEVLEAGGHRDLVVAACYNADVPTGRELCRRELGYTPHELLHRLGEVGEVW